jgi:hypothetical protein
MIVDSLVFRHPDPDVEGYLPPEEIIERVTKQFPLAVVDRERADQMIREQADELASYMSGTDFLVTRHRAMVGRVAYVNLRERDEGPEFGFFLYPEPTVIDIDYQEEEERDICRPLLKALQKTLPEYDFVTEELDDDDE